LKQVVAIFRFFHRGFNISLHQNWGFLNSIKIAMKRKAKKQECLKFLTSSKKVVKLFPEHVRDWMAKAGGGISDFRVIQRTANALEIQVKVLHGHRKEIENRLWQMVLQFSIQQELDMCLDVYFSDLQKSSTDGQGEVAYQPIGMKKR
jgi:hypothetical protein